MSFSSFSLILLCAFAWSLFDLSRKRMGHALPVFRSLFLFMWVQLPVFVVGALLNGSPPIRDGYWLPGLVGIAVNFLANSLFIWSVSIAPLGHTVPMLSFTCVVSALSSYLLLGETLSSVQVAGIGLVTVGAFLLNGLPSFRDRERKGAWLMGLASIFWGSMAVVDKLCLQFAHSTTHAAVQTAGIAVVVSLILWRRKEMKITLRTAPSQAFNLALGTAASSAAILLQLHVIQSVAVGLFEAVKRVVSMTLAVAWGRLLWDERVTRQKVFSLVLMAVGLVLLLAPRSVLASTTRWDASVDAGVRTYPKGAAVGFEGGYNALLWGDASGVRYGYSRLGARLQSSGVVSRADAKLSVFPVSFLGVELSSGIGHRGLEEISSLDCAVARCDGAVTRTQLSVPLMLAAGPFFGRAKLDYSWIAASDAGSAPGGLLADESSNLNLRAAGDQLRRWEFLVGAKLDEDLRAMFYFDRTRAMRTGSRNRAFGLLGQKSWGDHALVAGVGLYDSTTAATHGQVLVAYKFTIARGLAL